MSSLPTFADVQAAAEDANAAAARPEAGDGRRVVALGHGHEIVIRPLLREQSDRILTREEGDSGIPEDAANAMPAARECGHATAAPMAMARALMPRRTRPLVSILLVNVDTNWSISPSWAPDAGLQTWMRDPGPEEKGGRGGADPPVAS
mgnify:CR=1 FL=1